MPRKKRSVYARNDGGTTSDWRQRRTIRSQAARRRIELGKRVRGNLRRPGTVPVGHLAIGLHARRLSVHLCRRERSCRPQKNSTMTKRLLYLIYDPTARTWLTPDGAWTTTVATAQGYATYREAEGVRQTQEATAGHEIHVTSAQVDRPGYDSARAVEGICRTPSA